VAHITRTIAERKGDALALVDERGTTSWGQFDARVNQLIHGFQGMGLVHGDTVALMCGNRAAFFEVMTAGLHSGLYVVPVNWHWVAKELAYVIDDSDAKAIVVDGRFSAVAASALDDPRTSSCRTRIAVEEHPPDGFDAYEEILSSLSSDEPKEQATGAPMFYTSGTTGFPKGVRSTVTRVGLDPDLFTLVAAGASTMLRLPPEGVTLLEGPAYHSAQWAFSLLPLLGVSSTLVMRHHFDPAELLSLIDEHRVTNIHLVPTQFNRLLRLPESVRNAFDGTSLVTVVHGAAPCPVGVKEEMLRWWGPVINEYYGGTEGGFLTYVTAEEWLERPGTLGKSTQTSDLFVVDDDGKPCAPGQPGQIYFKNKTGADFVYHKAPDKTAAAHLESGMGTLGDVGFLDDEGYLFLTDRKIDMIISGGVNIYPAEIEGVLVGHPSVADAAVFGIPDDEMGEQVKAAVELVDGVTPSDELAAELIEHARAHLAGYKAPKTIDFEDHLPRHPTGKLYKRLLRDPYWQESEHRI
jgi:long-chain acyl-CoA synthetase